MRSLVCETSFDKLSFCFDAIWCFEIFKNCQMDKRFPNFVCIREFILKKNNIIEIQLS